MLGSYAGTGLCFERENAIFECGGLLRAEIRCGQRPEFAPGARTAAVEVAIDRALVRHRLQRAPVAQLDRRLRNRDVEIVARVDVLSDRMLAARLKELEQIGLIDRIVEPTTPVSVRYRLTARGQDLLASLQPLVAYGQRWESRRPS